jgi:hypothetical protein
MSILSELEKQDVLVQALEFNEETITIYFQEKRNVSETALVSNVMEILMDTDIRQQTYLNLQEILCDLINTTYVEIRNPEDEL